MKAVFFYIDRWILDFKKIVFLILSNLL